jgi:chemotaxis protein MotA
MITALLAFLFQTFGLILIFGSVYYATFVAEHTEVIAYVIHKPSMLIVFVGLLGVLMATTHFKEIIELIKMSFLNSPTKIWNQIIYVEDHFEEMTNRYYKEGAKGILSVLDKNKISKTWLPVIDQLDAKIDPQDIKRMVQRNFFKIKENYQHKIKTVEMLVGAAPSLGMFGTVFGLIKLLATLSDFSSIGPNMSLALVTTLYGIFASILLNPLVKHLENKFRKTTKNYEQITFWLDMIKDKKPGFYMNQEYGKR